MLNKAQLCKECRTCKKWNKCPYGKEGLENGTSIGYSIGECKDYEPYPYEDAGELSDGYHTFNQLYHQRAILFATIVNQNKDKAWKSFKHSDGHYCFDEDGEMFIVGIDTPKGSYTYHYHKKYWDYFDCKELECGKVWDGHTEEDVTRLLSLEQQPCEDCISREAMLLLQTEYAEKMSATTFWELRDDIRKLPSVTPQRPKGTWIKVDPLGIGVEAYMCSECKTGDWSVTVGEYKFCPYCGAKMEAKDET